MHARTYVRTHASRSNPPAVLPELPVAARPTPRNPHACRPAPWLRAGNVCMGAMPSLPSSPYMPTSHLLPPPLPAGDASSGRSHPSNEAVGLPRLMRHLAAAAPAVAMMLPAAAAAAAAAAGAMSLAPAWASAPQTSRVPGAVSAACRTATQPPILPPPPLALTALGVVARPRVWPQLQRCWALQPQPQPGAAPAPRAAAAAEQRRRIAGLAAAGAAGALQWRRPRSPPRWGRPPAARPATGHAATVAAQPPPRLPSAAPARLSGPAAPPRPRPVRAVCPLSVWRMPPTAWLVACRPPPVLPTVNSVGGTCAEVSTVRLCT